jgi:chromosome segregation ATPase
MTIRILNSRNGFVAMKTKYALCLLSCCLLTLTGCDKAEKTAMQSQISELRNNNVALQARFNELSSSNLILEGKLLELQQKVKSGEELNALLRQQLDSANAQITKGVEMAKANAEGEKQKPIEEAIRAIRRFDSAATVSITFDEYRKKLQDLKVALDETAQEITDAEIKQHFFSAYSDYQDTLSVWAASLGKQIGDYEAALKRQGCWSTRIPDYDKERYERMAKDSSGSVFPTTPVRWTP